MKQIQKNEIDLIQIGAMFSLKSVYSLEQRKDNNSIKPSMNFNSRKINIVNKICKLLDEYNITYCVIDRVKNRKDNFMTIRITYKKNLKNYLEVFEKYIFDKCENYNEIKKLVYSKNKK